MEKEMFKVFEIMTLLQDKDDPVVARVSAARMELKDGHYVFLDYANVPCAIYHSEGLGVRMIE